MEPTSFELHSPSQDLQSSMGEHSTTWNLGAMLGCYVVLLLMLVACSPPAQAHVIERQAKDVEARGFNIVVPMESLVVVPAPEDLPAPEKGRWQRFEEALNAGTRVRHHRIIESATNDGIRMSCYEPCLMNCCVSSGGYSTTGRGFGR